MISLLLLLYLSLLLSFSRSVVKGTGQQNKNLALSYMCALL